MSDTLHDRQREHVLYTWTAQTTASPVEITGGQGAVFYDRSGNHWLDFESQVFNCNVGHGNQRIIEAIKHQADTLACAHPAAVFDTKTQLGQALASVTPTGLDKMFLCLSGAEANENAMKMAMLVTGRTKVIARRNSYHGASLGALALTGDWRRTPFEDVLRPVVRAEDPYCFRCPFESTHPECEIRCASHIEALIQLEGPDDVAAIFLEGVTGAAGGFIPPPEYWPMVREICDRYGVLLISDEVLSGFGRTGKWFAVDHWDVVPDMMTMAKGITGGYAPMGAVAVNGRIAQHFENETLVCGLTCYAHPMSCAAALAAIDVYHDEGLIENSAQLGRVLGTLLGELSEQNERVIDVRNLGLWGCVELDADTDLGAVKDGLAKRHVHAAVKDSRVFLAPPLCIEESQLADGVGRLSDVLNEVS